MKTYIGTSGWLYGWNKQGTLEWYIKNSGMNAMELNSSFYRFPYKNQIKSWSERGKRLAWVIKVNRVITHVHMLNGKSYGYYESFTSSFSPFGKNLKLFLLQMPPRFSTNMKARLIDFVKSFNEKKMAIEFRHSSWYSYDFSKLDFGGVIVSPDSPEFNNMAIKKNGCVYLRFHGRKEWYDYRYNDKELYAMAQKVKDLKPKTLYAFFNNDMYMMENGISFYSML
ncbi:DUF72 domain-containing protein [Candidatus Marsarchaeota archaeon]|nr:DUF72 domain-containing protein [Candidatus Marsarchaeota archaeon]